MAKKTTWALAMDRGVDMVSINSGLLVRPGLSITNPYLKGTAEMYEDGVFVTVNEEFLAEARVCVYEHSSTYGRYVCFDRLIGSHEDTAKLAGMLSPSAPCPPPVREEMKIRQRIQIKKLNKVLPGDAEDGGLKTTIVVAPHLLHGIRTPVEADPVGRVGEDGAIRVGNRATRTATSSR